MAPKMELAGFRDDWIGYLQQGVQAGDRVLDHTTTAELCFQIGYLYRLLSKFDEAIRWLNECLAGANQPQHSVLKAKTLNQLAYVAWQQHEYATAIDFAQQALQLLAEDHVERAMSFSVLGLVSFHQRHLTESAQYHCEALRIREFHVDQRAIAWSQQNLGVALREQGKYDEALTCYTKAIALLEETHDRSRMAIAQMNLGIVYRRMQQHQKSLEMHLEAGKTFHKLGDKLNSANNYTNIGLQHISLGNLDSAAEAFRESSKLFFEIGNYSWQLNALDGLGIVYLKQNRFTEAYETFQQILAELPGINDQPMFEYLQRVVPSQLDEARHGKISG